MNRSHILLICILWIIFLMVINNVLTMIVIYVYDFPKEHINNDIPNNDVALEGDSRFLIPTEDEVYNPHDTNRIDNIYGHQEISLDGNNENTESVNTDLSIPLVYSLDEIKETTIASVTPSITDIIDTGSGVIIHTDNINNNVLNNFHSIE
jgi:hypothetical protein